MVNISPEQLAELAQIENVVAVKQANDDELQPVDGPRRACRQRRNASCATLEMGEPGGILVASHLVGPEMREIYDAVQAGDIDRARRDRRRAPPDLRGLRQDQPDPRQGGPASCSGSVPPGRRLPIVEADEEQRAEVRRTLEAHGSADRERRLGLSSPSVRILPLGGLGEIGKNMTVVEVDGRIVVVDTGLMFPTADMLGIDLVLPDFSMLRERADDIEAIVLTHGHEDHVGALPVRAARDRHAAGDLRRAADDRHGPLEARRAQAAATCRWRSCRPASRSSVGPFGIELVHMAHSIPDARAVALTHRRRAPC